MPNNIYAPISPGNGNQILTGNNISVVPSWLQPGSPSQVLSLSGDASEIEWTYLPGFRGVFAPTDVVPAPSSPLWSTSSTPGHNRPVIDGDYILVESADADAAPNYADLTDDKWVSVSGGGTALTPAQIKQLYESNSNTNAFTDAAKQFVDKYGASNIPLSFNPINLASTSSGVVDVNGNVTNGVTGILPYSSGGRGDVDAMEWTVSGPIYIKAKRYGSVVSLSISSAAVGAIPAASTFVTLSAGWRPLDDINISITNRATAGTLSPVVFTVSTAGAVSNQYAVASGGSFSGAATFICDRS